MNVELLNPFRQSFPEHFDSSIDAGAICARFNPRGKFAGHLLAVGKDNGVVTVLDFETKGVIKVLEGHVRPITAVCWSRNSRYLLTASKDWNVIVWDLSRQAVDSSRGERKHTIRFDGPILSAHFHPRNSKMLIVTLQGHSHAIFVDLRESTKGRWNLEAPNEDEDADDEEVDSRNVDSATVARFNHTGDLVYVGTSTGYINIFDVQTKDFLWSESTGSPSAIKHMEFDKTGRTLITNSNDRFLRVFPLTSEPPEIDSEFEATETIEPPPPRPNRVPYFAIEHKFQDLIGRTNFNGCGFSRDGDYIIAGAGHKATHNVYMWDRDTGGLVKILEGPKDPLEDLEWHPTKPLLVSVSSLGFIHIWTTVVTENWSAYAPGFEELDENIEYEEKEDEFDIEDESVKKKRKENEQDKPIDILGPVDSTTTYAGSVDPRNDNSDQDTSMTVAMDDTDEFATTFEAFCAVDPDDDIDPDFFPPSEIEYDSTTLKSIQERHKQYVAPRMTPDNRQFGCLPDSDQQRNQFIDLKVKQQMDKFDNKRKRLEEFVLVNGVWYYNPDYQNLTEKHRRVWNR
ncbi:chromatin binding protein [Microbotryomycetes sp. JL221]|nr:chromatin binding protein [Microbotryomycetes sp. JL221]